MELFSARNVNKVFASTHALTNVSISVKEQSIFGLLGPNGAGKTTLIRIINQITAPDDGELFLEGRKMRQSDVALIGYLPEERGLYKKNESGRTGHLPGAIERNDQKRRRKKPEKLV